MQLVDDLRRMTGVGSAQYEIDGRAYWTDDDLEAAITDRLCARLVQVEVDLIPTISETSQLVFLTGRVRTVGTIDTESATVVTLGGKPIEDATIHPDGRVDFATDQASTVPLLTALAYDLNGAAADVLTQTASTMTGAYDITIDGQSMKRSQARGQLVEQAEAFRSRAVVGSVHMIRSDTKAIRHGGHRRSDAVLRSWKRWGRPQG